MRYFWILGLFFLSLLGNTGFAQENKKSEIVQGPFKTELFPEGEIYFEQSQQDDDVCQPIRFILKYKENNQLIKNDIDKYDQEGGCPEIRSVFFMTIQHKKYILVMVSWDSKHVAAGTDGDLYQTYAYTINQKGILSLDKKISKNNNLSGFDGEQNCKNDYYNPEGVVNCTVHYKYKTALEVKRYLKRKYH